MDPIKELISRGWGIAIKPANSDLGRAFVLQTFKGREMYDGMVYEDYALSNPNAIDTVFRHLLNKVNKTEIPILRKDGKFPDY